MKDNFSTQSDRYAQFRPGYPLEIFLFLKKHVAGRNRAWDCGTGNGQVASQLADFFKEVYATDISVPQLMQAVDKPNIHYTKQRAEKTNFPDSCFDLITVAQAIHWFDFDAFYREVCRTLKLNGLLAVMGYGLFESNEATDKVIHHLYKDLVGPHWDEERKYLEERYETIPFPFEELESPHFKNTSQWSLERLVGYLKTWSAVKRYEEVNKENPVDKIYPDLKKSFGEKGRVTFPILFRIGKNEKK